MKVIGLIPFKNEEHFLPTYLSNVKPICDEIIAVDDHSTDNSRKIMEEKQVVHTLFVLMLMKHLHLILYRLLEI